MARAWAMRAFVRHATRQGHQHARPLLGRASFASQQNAAQSSLVPTQNNHERDRAAAAAAVAAEFERRQRQLADRIKASQPDAHVGAAVLDAYASIQHSYNTTTDVGGFHGILHGVGRFMDLQVFQQAGLLQDLEGLFAMESGNSAAVRLLQLALRMVLGDPGAPLPSALEVPEGFPTAPYLR